MRLIDADAIRVKAEYLQNICGIIMIRTEDLVKIINEQPTIPYDMKWNPDCEVQILTRICDLKATLSEVKDGKNYKQQSDGTWKKAIPIPYYSNFFERIWNWIRRLMKIT